MNSALLPLVLGSASPRRLQILEQLGLSPSVRPRAIDESPRSGELPDSYVERIALAKLTAIAPHLGPRPIACLVADTTVALGDELLGKPRDHEDACDMLRALCGQTHRVLTCYAVATYFQEEADNRRVVRTVITDVTMRAATEREIAGYVATGECHDKAGAYGIQGKGAFLVEAIRGSYSNVVGLPICELVLDLKQLGVLGDYP